MMMLRDNLWETANGVLSLLGFFLTLMILVFLLSNLQKSYTDPVRVITLAFAAIILGHTIKDGAAYLSRCCQVTTPDWVVITAIVLIGLGKLTSIKIWTRPSWGQWPWVLALLLVVVFLLINSRIV